MVDCAAAPTKPTAVKDVAGARAYHGIAFDGAGSLIGAHGGTIYKATTSSSKILAAGFSDVQGIDRFPNGDFAVVATESEDNSSLVRITDAGAQDKLAEVSYDAYGVRVVPSGWVYVGQPEGLLLVNAATKETRTVDVPASPRVMDYSPDRQRLYVGTLTADLGEDPADGLGPIYVFDLDATNLPVGKARLFASNVGGGWHDGLGVDACGNLFVADYSTSGLYRVTPKGDVSLFHQWTETSYGHGLSWGSGVGGWNKLSLYQPQPYNEDTVVEVVVGVPARAP